MGTLFGCFIQGCLILVNLVQINQDNFDLQLHKKQNIYLLYRVSRDCPFSYHLSKKSRKRLGWELSLSSLLKTDPSYHMEFKNYQRTALFEKMMTRWDIRKYLIQKFLKPIECKLKDRHRTKYAQKKFSHFSFEFHSLLDNVHL